MLSRLREMIRCRRCAASTRIENGATLVLTLFLTLRKDRAFLTDRASTASRRSGQVRRLETHDL